MIFFIEKISLFTSIRGKIKKIPPGYLDETAKPEVILSIQILNKSGLFFCP
jgi:hypothetical protein